MIIGHDPAVLSGYALDALDAPEKQAVELHLQGCERCLAELNDLRIGAAALENLPPEALLDGSPQGSDLSLQRARRRVRAERASQRRRARVVAGAAAALIAVALVGAGTVIGRTTAPSIVAEQSPDSAAESVTASARDRRTGANMAVAIEPAVGWVRISAEVAGIKVGQQCRLIVVSADGTRREAGSWLVSEKAAHQGTKVTGAALIEPENVSAVDVETLDGTTLVSVPV